LTSSSLRENELEFVYINALLNNICEHVITKLKRTLENALGKIKINNNYVTKLKRTSYTLTGHFIRYTCPTAR